MKDLSVVVPAHNEEETIKQAIEELHSFLVEGPYSFEILIVENHSTDKTWEFAKDLEHIFDDVRAIQSKPGKGAAILEGWRMSEGDVLVFMDADLSPALQTISDLVGTIDAKGGCAIADRFHDNSYVTRSLKREVVSRAWQKIAHTALPLPRCDYQCGAKAISRDAFKGVESFVQSVDWFFDAELLLYFVFNDLPITPVPTQWVEKRFASRKSRLPLISTAIVFIGRLIATRQKLSHLEHRARQSFENQSQSAQEQEQTQLF